MNSTIPLTTTFDRVALIRSCYTQRFGIPRQAGLVPAATAQIVFPHTRDNELSLRGLEEFSHLWVIFLFHKQHYAKSKPLVSPPRLGGKKSMGVFATRSPNRPNPIGMSAVGIDEITTSNNEILIHIRGGDFLDGTPVLDIKPYIGFADAIPDATSTWVSPIDKTMSVNWTENATAEINQCMSPHSAEQLASAIQLINQTIAQDPRPGYERDKDGLPDQQWHMQILQLDVSWKVINSTAEITRVRHS